MKKLLGFLFLITSSMLASDNSYNALWTSVNNSCIEKYCNGKLLGCSQANQEKANQCTRKGVLTALQNKCQTKTPSCSAQELRMLSMYECWNTLCPHMDSECFRKHTQAMKKCSSLAFPQNLGYSQNNVLTEAQNYCKNFCKKKYKQNNYVLTCTNGCILSYVMESCLEQECSASELNAYSSWFNQQYMPWLKKSTEQAK